LKFFIICDTIKLNQGDTPMKKILFCMLMTVSFLQCMETENRTITVVNNLQDKSLAIKVFLLDNSRPFLRFRLEPGTENIAPILEKGEELIEVAEEGNYYKIVLEGLDRPKKVAKLYLARVSEEEVRTRSRKASPVTLLSEKVFTDGLAIIMGSKGNLVLADPSVLAEVLPEQSEENPVLADPRALPETT
jgi:hypothetical protein